jgi:hypothetical protein
VTGLVAVVACAAALVLAAAAGADRSSPRPAISDPATRARLIATVDSGLRLAVTRWGRDDWFTTVVDGDDWAPIWESVHLLSAATGLAAATGREADRRRVSQLARRAEGYWNPRLARGVGGFSTRYRERDVQRTNWFDDNGWLGLAFFSAYEQTGEQSFLRDASRALTYIDRVGWDKSRGGIWWSTAHTFKAGESIVTASLLAVRLWEATGRDDHLRRARRFIDWTNANLFDGRTGLYLNRQAGAPISYLQSPMLVAMARLCRSRELYCERVAPLVEATLARYGGSLTHAPQYDAMYLRFLADAATDVDDPRLVEVVYRNALRAERTAAIGNGVFGHDWSGGSRETRPRSLQAHAATLQALAWAAAAIG